MVVFYTKTDFGGVFCRRTSSREVCCYRDEPDARSVSDYPEEEFTEELLDENERIQRINTVDKPQRRMPSSSRLEYREHALYQQDDCTTKSVGFIVQNAGNVFREVKEFLSAENESVKNVLEECRSIKAVTENNRRLAGS